MNQLKSKPIVVDITAVPKKDVVTIKSPEAKPDDDKSAKATVGNQQM